MRCYENVEIAHHNRLPFLGIKYTIRSQNIIFKWINDIIIVKTRSSYTFKSPERARMCMCKIMNKSCWWHGIGTTFYTYSDNNKNHRRINAMRHFAFTFVFIFGDHKQVHLFTISTAHVYRNSGAPIIHSSNNNNKYNGNDSIELTNHSLRAAILYVSEMNGQFYGKVQ